MRVVQETNKCIQILLKGEREREREREREKKEKRESDREEGDWFGEGKRKKREREERARIKKIYFTTAFVTILFQFWNGTVHLCQIIFHLKHLM